MSLTLICGLSSSGKSTLARKLSGDPIAWDSFEGGGPERTERCNAEAALREWAVVEGIYIRGEMRESLCKAVGDTHKVCIWLDTPIDECLERERRDRCRGDALIRSQATRFEPPTYNEGWDEIWIARDGRYLLLEGWANGHQ